MEAAISAPYVTLALDELLKRGEPIADPIRTPPAAAHIARSARRPTPPVRSETSRASLIAGGPMTLAYEVEIAGQVSPNDFDILAQIIRSTLGEAGMAAAIGRTLS